MTDSSKKSQQGSRKQRAGQAAGKAQQGQLAARPSQRTLSRKRREERRQRMVVIVAGSAIGLALLALIIGVSYEQLWVPGRPLAQVDGETLTRRDYWQQRRYELAREVVQNFQLQALFGDNPQFGSQFAGRAPVINQQVAAIRTLPVDEQTISNWQNYQLTLQGAAGMGIEAGSDEVNQRLVNDLGSIFLPPPPITATDELTPTALAATAEVTATIEGDATAALTPTATLTPTLLPTMTPGGPTLTPTETTTPIPTDTPRPTPIAAVANEQVPEIIDTIVNQYTTEVELAGQEPELTREDFAGALEQQYREQVLIDKVQAELVPEESFTPSTEPERVQARHILLAVDVPEDASEEEIDAAYAERRDEAEALVAQLRAGTDFAELAAEESDDPGSRDDGGNVGFFDREGVADTGATYDPAFVAAAFALEGDAISDPVRTQFGWHIIQVTDRQVPTEAEQLRAAREEAFAAWLEEQREEIGVRRFPEPTATPTLPADATEVPTAAPTFLPGPPTPAPTSTPEPTPTEAPTVAPTEGLGPPVPTATPDTTPTTGE